jgi:GNAT superfamily N-acetyltransferase
VEQIVVSDAVVLVEDEIREDQRLAIISPFGEFSAERGFEFHPNPIYLSLRDGDRIVGGLIGHTNWEWLHTEILSVATHPRSRGYGRQLMETAEGIARGPQLHRSLGSARQIVDRLPGGAAIR